MRWNLGIALVIFCSGCVLPDVSDEELGTLSPPCAPGWTPTSDQRGCMRARDAGAGMDAGGTGDAGEPPMDGGSSDAGHQMDAGGSSGDAGASDAGSDAGTSDPDAGPPSCLDPLPSTGMPPDPIPTSPVINEYVFKHNALTTLGTDYYEFVEIFGPPSTDFSDLTVVVINSHDGRNLGSVLHVIPVGRTNDAGFWRSCDGYESSDDAFVQSSASLLLVRGWSGLLGADLDVDNDGTLDSTPWTEIIDQVAFDDQDVDSDTFYATPVLTPDGYEGHPITGSRLGASRYPNGYDTDSEEDWRKNHYAGSGFPESGSSPRATEAWNTPGAPNRIQ